MGYKKKIIQSEVGRYGTGEKITQSKVGQNWSRFNEIQRYGKRVTYRK